MRRHNPDAANRAVWMTGLSGSGKSTIAMALKNSLDQVGRNAQILDGDTIRRATGNTSFSKEDRLEHGLHVGRMALELVESGNIAIVALISPYQEGRQRVRSLFSMCRFLEVHISTPLELCEARDVKGLYAKARTGEIPHFTGITDPYEMPISPDITINTAYMTPQQAVDQIFIEGFPEIGR